MEKYQAPWPKLRRLSDEEWSRANALARKVPLERCPTCGSKPEVIPDSGGETHSSVGTFRYRGKEYECDCKLQRMLRTRYLVANIGDQYHVLDWNDFSGSPEVTDVVNDYIENWESFSAQGFGLEFGGAGLGTGKTWAAVHIGKELIKRRQEVYFIPFVEMVSAFHRDDGTEIEDRICQTPYVILDEISPAVSDRQREFFAFRFEAVIRHRTNYNLPTIITTNLGEDELHEIYPRVYSLLAAKQVRVDMAGEDAREGIVAKENLELIANDERRPIT